MMQKSEAIVDALSFLNNCHRPDSLAYSLRNPILLRSWAKAGRHQVDENGLRVFDSLLAGYKAATFDVNLKLSGNSNSGLKTTDTLRNLLKVYAVKQEPDVVQVISYLKKALRNPEISQTTPLSYFLD